MDKRQKWLVLVWGLLWLSIGALAGPALLAGVIGNEPYPSLKALVVAVLGGGGLLAFFALRSMKRTRAWTFRLPPTWALGGGFVLALATGLGLWHADVSRAFLVTLFVALAAGLVPLSGGFVLALAAGLGLWQADISRGFLVPLLAALAGGLAPLATVGWVTGRQPSKVNARQGWVSFGVGATASTLLASLLNAILFVVFDLAWISFPGADTLLPLIDGVVIAPLVEELAKPLVLLSLLQRVESARDALLLGMLAGTGFAALENLLYAAAAGPIWGGVLAVRAMNAALHPFGAGLMAVAWWRVLRREPGASGLWMRNYGLAVGVHALHNGICFAGGGGDWFEGWWVLLLALLLAEGIVLPLPLRALARRLALEAEGRPAAALPTERALAAWGLACLVVLLPVGLGIWQMVR